MAALLTRSVQAVLRDLRSLADSRTRCPTRHSPAPNVRAVRGLFETFPTKGFMRYPPLTSTLSRNYLNGHENTRRWTVLAQPDRTANPSLPALCPSKKISQFMFKTGDSLEPSRPATSRAARLLESPVDVGPRFVVGEMTRIS